MFLQRSHVSSLIMYFFLLFFSWMVILRYLMVAFLLKQIDNFRVIYHFQPIVWVFLNKSNIELLYCFISIRIQSPLRCWKQQNYSIPILYLVLLLFPHQRRTNSPILLVKWKLDKFHSLLLEIKSMFEDLSSFLWCSLLQLDQFQSFLSKKIDIWMIQFKFRNYVFNAPFMLIDLSLVKWEM